MRPSATPSTSAPSGVPNTGTSIKPPATQAPFQTETQQTPTSTTSPTPTTAPAPSGVTQQPAAGADASQTQAPGAQQAGQPGTVSATINYDEGGPSVPSSSEVSILQSLNEALVKGPRAAALRAQLAIAKSGLSAATVSPNPIFFMDRGLVAEAVRRVGPTFTIDPPWKLAFRMLAASRLYAQTRIDLMTQLWSLRADVRRAYTEAVIAIEAQRTLTELYELTERLLEVSEKRFQAGDVPELDVLRARLATSQADVDRNVGRQRVVRARQQLNIIMGRAVEGRIEVPRLPDFLTQNQILSGRSTKHGILPDFSQPVPPLQYFLDIAEKNRYELRSLDQQVKVNKANLYNAMGAAVPDPIVTTGQSQAGNPPFGPKVTAQFFTLNIEMPMTNTNQGDITKFQATGRQLRYQIQAQRNQVIADVSSAYNNLLAARERIRVYQEHVLRDSNEVARLSRRSYEVGQSDINSTLLAQQANVGIRQAYLDAVTNYQGAYTDLEQACGRPLE
ncbi:MAG TPA: TolC family protein [Planktothrix sp.]